MSVNPNYPKHWSKDRRLQKLQRQRFELDAAIFYLQSDGDWNMVLDQLSQKYNITIQQAYVATDSEAKAWNEDKNHGN